MFESAFSHVVTWFIATCWVFLIILLSFLPRWFRNQAQPTPIHGVVHCLAEWLSRVPLQVMRPKSRSRSPASTPINFPSRKNSFTTADIDDLPAVAASDTTETIEAGQLTSPLFTQEQEVSANPFSTSVHQQAAASGSQQQPASSSVMNLWQMLNVGSCGKLQQSGE